jgi:glycosyltransferase involved in cell wall biosynthesis
VHGPVPTFSVVIAAYQAAATIAEAVESALAQTSPPLEVIVCDDGSTDDTQRALEPYGDRIVLVRKEHGGAASARNFALGHARGDFFAVLDADDAYLPGRLEALAELAGARPDLDLLCTDAYLELDGRVVARFGESCAFEVSDQRAAILERCFCAWPAYRRALLAQVGGFDESLRTGSDWEAVIRLLRAGAAAGLVDEPLYRYRLHGRSLTSDRVAKLRDRVRILEHVGRSGAMTDNERAALRRSLTVQERELRLTQAEAAIRARSADARGLALAAARTRGVPLRSRAAALVATLAPRAAARALEHRDHRGGPSRLRRSFP